jgi:hypothetical protein
MAGTGAHLGRNAHHEYASRLVERGVPLSQVRDLLGHHSILTTERYDNQTLDALQAAARKLDTGRTFQNGSSSGDPQPDAHATPEPPPGRQHADRG